MMNFRYSIPEVYSSIVVVSAEGYQEVEVVAALPR
jgi:hypothetical protein